MGARFADACPDKLLVDRCRRRCWTEPGTAPLPPAERSETVLWKYGIYIMMKRALLFPIFFAAFTASAQVKPINATIDAGKIGAPISKYVYGQFLELDPEAGRGRRSQDGALLFGRIADQLIAHSDDQRQQCPVRELPVPRG
jgi:hypothetical protein